MPDARDLNEDGARDDEPSGLIACLIEQTPGGRRFMIETTFSRLHDIGLSHRQVALLLPTISRFMEATCGVDARVRLGDVFMPVEPAIAEAIEDVA